MDEPEALRSRYAALLERIRQASRDGAVLRLAERAEPGGAGVSPADLIALLERGGLDDLAVVGQGRHTYLYSTRHMTRPYAETAARVAEGDILRLIAETVRADSATYPRPTAIATFTGRPFDLAPDQIALALEQLAADAGFDDVRKVTASDGTVFLYSTRHLEPAHAASLAEWLAVGRADNP